MKSIVKEILITLLPALIALIKEIVEDYIEDLRKTEKFDQSISDYSK